MKTKSGNLAAALAVAWAAAAIPLQARIIDAVEDRAKAPADAGVEVQIDGRPMPQAVRDAGGHATSHSESKSVSVHSDGRQTIRRTVITRNGVTEETTEILDGNGAPADEGGAACEERPQPGQDGPIGVQVQEADAALRDQLDLAQDEGLVLVRVIEHGPAAEGGLQANDILLQANDRPLATPADLEQVLRELEAGDRLTLEYLRKGLPGTAVVEVGECKDAPDDKAAGEGNAEQRHKTDAQVRIQGNPAFEPMLDDPDIPQAFRDHLRELLRTAPPERE